MRKLTRRQFMYRSSVAAAAASVGVGCSDHSDRSHDSTPRVVIIGSGFAGSVAALRLAQAGIQATVLERGRHWELDGPDSFPMLGSNDKRKTWFGEVDGLVGGAATTPWAGMIERVSGDSLDAVCGAGVGGGSLVYGGVLLQPPRDVFSSVLPPINYDDMDHIYYPRVLQEIGAGPIPDDILASPNYAAHRNFIADCMDVGFDVSKPSAGFDWEIIRQEVAGSIPVAASVSEYIYGCNSGAKLSTDKNYLSKASASGLVDIRSLTEVDMISELPTGGYAITCRRINEEGQEQERYEVNATHLILAAGSLNSSKLLLKSQQAGELRAGNDRIGKAWGTNGDQLMLEFSNRPVGGAQGGPACIAAIDRTDSQYPVTFMHSPANVPADIQIQLAMSVPDSLGELTYDAQTDKSSITWPTDNATGAAIARVNSFQRLLDFTGGSNISGAGGRPTVWHPLGGLVMGETCDYSGQLYGYENLFVVDGSLLPGSAAGANPSLTIAANAERIMEHIVPAVLAYS